VGTRIVREALARDGPGAPSSRVSTLELFFDLVFVFAVTQLTGTLLRSPGWTGIGRACVLLATLLWIYDAFAWLTNAAAPRSTSYRLSLLTGMACFLVMALAVPTVFSGTGVAFGLAFLAATVVHLGLFLRVGRAAARRAMLAAAPRNLLIAGTVLAACLTSGGWSTVFWVVTIAQLVLAGIGERESGFQLSPEHFVERMGLLVIVVLGESVVAVGAAASTRIAGRTLSVDAGLATDAVAGLALCAALWWCWFARDDEVAASAFAAVPSATSSRLAMLAFGYPFLLVLGGVVLVAAGLHGAVAHPGDRLAPALAWYLAGGVSAFLAGTVLVRMVLQVGGWRLRAAAALLALALVALGTGVSAQAEVAGLTLAVVVLLAVESRAADSAAATRADVRIPDPESA